MNKYILQYFTGNGSFDLEEHLIPLIGNDKEELKIEIYNRCVENNFAPYEILFQNRIIHIKPIVEMFFNIFTLEEYWNLL